MRIRSILLSAVAIGVFSLGLSAQKKTTFTSTYTNLGTGCKTLKGGDGQDDASLCNGPGGYQVRIYSSAMMVHINAEKKGTDETYPIVNVGLEFNQREVRLEWRHANGKPFAVIIRVPKYDGRTDEQFGQGKIIGEELIVSGIGDYEFINASIDVKTPKANAKARAAADKGYTGK